MLTVTTAQADIVVHDLGGLGAPVLLAHAAGFHGKCWRPVTDRTAGAFRFLAPDARGHGWSGKPVDDDFDWRGAARDLLTVIDALELEAPRGVGHSSGATTLLLAEQARPGTFRALWCFEPVIVPADPPLGRDRDNWLATAARRRHRQFPSRAAALAAYESRKPLATFHPGVLRAYVEDGFADQGDGSVRLRCEPEHEALVYEMATAHDCFAHLPDVACPVTVVSGARSEVLAPDTAADLVTRLQNGRSEVLPGTGHFAPFEDPVVVAGSVSRFLARSR